MASEAELKRYYETRYTSAHNQLEIQQQAAANYEDQIHHLLSTVGAEKSDCRLVDFGCSFPLFTERAKAIGLADPIGVDHSAEALEYAERRGLTLLTPDQFFESVAPKSVDILRFTHVLEHLVDPKRVLARAFSKLRPGGLLHISQPNFPVFRTDAQTQPLRDSVYPEHLHFFSALSMLRMVESLRVRMYQFFTHYRVVENYADLHTAIDVPYARRALERVSEVGEETQGQYSGYPWYTGENSCVYAIKTWLDPLTLRVGKTCRRIARRLADVTGMRSLKRRLASNPAHTASNPD